ncbi:acyltransferase [Pyrenochaeta sp. MPI-SDFR-AT-0127]|nr:acyltransferase [Pyrenochaeta sp. MPI-SDFR-AT-0127]
MRRKQTFQLHPPALETSEEEWFRLSILDMVVPPNYNTYAIIFKQNSSSEEAIIETFKRGLEATLQQCRHLVGKIQKNKHGDYSVVRSADSTVEFVVQWLNTPSDDYPSYDDLERSDFTLASLRDHTILGVEGIPDSCHPDDSPIVVGFQLNLIRNGFIFTAHIHHFALDMTGTTSLIHQIAENCSSVVNLTPKPRWDESFMDRSRFIAPDIAVEDQIDPPPRPERHPDWLSCSWLLFHLPPGKSKDLKQLATPLDGTWISTYDAVIALLWRVIMRTRAKVYKPDILSPAIFGEPINMRNRCTPKVSARYQGNVLAAGLSMHQENPLTLADVISRASLSQIAVFVRAITHSVGQHTLDETMGKVAPIRDKSNLDMPLDSLPPMSFTTTDWRNSKLCDNDFGIGQPVAYRCLYNTVVENMIILYPPHKGYNGKSGGIEVMLPIETHAIGMLMDDPDIKKFFEFRSIEVKG